ncbi:hypothetical protein WICPIJ_006727 [Wickerhamomyces pijperi]|uniref:Amino acid permease/ SLC12A domain-containing protein n=1 Tax=Wickerhamomyces pijperi TaxID=599730 RepID=A0A9P8Q1T9_WICPI|nr:hypothetical protein WICPIJ_006727 [Wickerhamomyces pijperi]
MSTTNIGSHSDDINKLQTQPYSFAPDIEKTGDVEHTSSLEYQTTNISNNGEVLEEGEEKFISVHEGYRLKKDLKARHVSMIAIGGALGTGLLIGSGSALSSSGPASLLIGYSFIGLVIYMVMCCIGELATYIPLSEGFAGYASRYCDDSLGFAVGYCYLFKYFIITPNQMVAGALVLQYWIPSEKVNPGVWIVCFMVLITLINVIGVKFFGEFEFWLSSLKVLIVLGLILLLLVIALGGAPTHDRLGFRYWENPGAFKPYSGISDLSKAKFVSFINVLVTAVFAYSGTELVGITIAEAENPRRNVPKAIRLTFYRIVVFYICSVLLLGMCVPYNDKLLISATKATTSANASPFVVAIKNAQIHGLDHLINACILIFIISAANSDLYIGSRTLYGLAANGKAPKFFAKTNRWGIPYNALTCCLCFACLAFMCVAQSSADVFNYFVNVVSIFGLLTWISILTTHIYFNKALDAQGVDKSTLAYRAPFQPYGTYAALVVCIIVAFIKNFTVFINGFNYKTFITGYIGLPVYVIAYFGYKFTTGARLKNPVEVDLYSLKHFVDQEEEEGKLKDEERRQHWANGSRKDGAWYYEKLLGWLF